MKKVFQIGALVLGLCVAQLGFSDYYGNNGGCNPCAPQDQGQVIQDGACPQEGPCGDQSTGDCWCKYVRYKPCYYTTKRCVEEKIPCKKKCCRYVDQYYEVQKCRMVPEYYTEQACKKVPEVYYVDDCKTCKKWVCDQHVKYVPEYYWKHVCGDNSGCNAPCPQGNPAPQGCR